MIIGLTGGCGAGKDAVAEHLVRKGFGHISLSDILREEAAKRKIKPSRENLIVLGNKLRQEFNPGFFAIRALERMKPDKNYVVTSIRHPGEVEALQSRKDFVLVAVDAPAELRFKRLLARAREGDIRTFEEFLLREQQERCKEDGPGMQMHKCFDMARIVLMNTGTIEELHKKVDRMLQNLFL